MEGNVEDETEGREGRKTAHREWISRGLDKWKDWDQNMATDKVEGNR